MAPILPSATPFSVKILLQNSSCASLLLCDPEDVLGGTAGHRGNRRGGPHLFSPRDGTLSDFSWASDKVDLALVQKWRVDIAYVYRDTEMALYGAVERATKEGRSVPLSTLPANHRVVQRFILQLMDKCHDNPNVNFTLVRNVGMKGVTGKPS